MINGIMKAIRHFEAIRKEQAQAQSDRDPFLPYPDTKNTRPTPLQGPANDTSNGECGCTSICNACVEYQMTLNQAH